MVAHPGLVGFQRLVQPSRPGERLSAAHDRVAFSLIGGDERVVSRYRFRVVTTPRQSTSKGDSSFGVPRLSGDVATIQGVCVVKAIVPRAQRGEAEDGDGRRVGLAADDLLEESGGQRVRTCLIGAVRPDERGGRRGLCRTRSPNVATAPRGASSGRAGTHGYSCGREASVPEEI